MVSVGGPVQEDITDMNPSSSSDSLSKGKRVVSHHSEDAGANLDDIAMIGLVKDESSWFSRNRSLVRRLRLFALGGLILGWWISATILQATRHRWIVQTFFAWSFIAIIAFRFIPTSVVTRPVEAVWIPFVQRPFFALPKYVRYGLGWLALLAITLGSAFGFELENVRNLYFFFFFYGHMSLLNPLADPRWPD
jgi:CNT family concentrative nucleoside transporter